MTTPETPIPTAQSDPKAVLNTRLESVAWALFLIMIGCLWLIPDEIIPQGSWSIGVGLILLGLNAFRSINGIPMSRFTIFLGTLALLSGIGDYLGLNLPIFAILLILLGLNILYKIIYRPKQST
jgi:hypothetical protein